MKKGKVSAKIKMHPVKSERFPGPSPRNLFEIPEGIAKLRYPCGMEFNASVKVKTVNSKPNLKTESFRLWLCT